jgi:hypothetical protein
MMGEILNARKKIVSGGPPPPKKVGIFKFES